MAKEQDPLENPDRPPEYGLVVSQAGGILEDPAECLRCFLISFWDEVRVDVEGRAGIPMTQASRDGAHVDTGGQESCRHVMPEIMEANARHSGLPADLPERSRGRVGVPC